MVYLKEDYLRPKSLTPIYPPYHQGEYLEEYFYSHYQQLEDKPEREYIDIFWSNIFVIRFGQDNHILICKTSCMTH